MGFSVMDRRSIRRPPSRKRDSETLGVGLLALGGALAVNSVLGPLLLDVTDYPVSETMRNQTIGLDAANLFVVAPLCAAVGWLALEQNRWAPLLALGPTTYAAYMFVQYIAGPDHAAYVQVLPLQLLTFVLGWMLAAHAWRIRPHLDRSQNDGGPHAIVAGLLAAFVVLRYLPGLVGSVTGAALPAALQTDLAMYWLIFLMDLGVFVPVAVVISIGLRRGSEWAIAAHTGLVGWYLLVTVAVFAMSISMVVGDDPYAGNGQLALFAALTVAVLAYAVVLTRAMRIANASTNNGNRP